MAGLRAAAIILVVLGHSTSDPASASLAATTPFLSILGRYIYSFHMPLFLWLAGYVFYHSSMEKHDDINVVRELFKKFKRLVIPFYATGFLVLIPTQILFGRGNEPFIERLKDMLLTRNIEHLWFIRSLFCIFLIAIPFHKQLKMINVYSATAICLLLLTINQIGPVAQLFARDVLLFFTGFLTRKYVGNIRDREAFLSFILLFSAHFYLFSLSANSMLGRHTAVLYYLRAFLGIYFMYFLFRSFSWNTQPEYVKKITDILDQSSYTIYLFHMTFIYASYALINTCFPGAQILSFAIAFTAGTVLPAVIHFRISKSRILSFLFSVKI